MFLSSTAFAAMLMSLVAILLWSAVIVFVTLTMFAPLATIMVLAGRRYVASRFFAHP